MLFMGVYMVGGGLEEDWGGLEKDWRKVGERLEKDWRRIGEGLEKDWRRIGEGLDKDWRRTADAIVLCREKTYYACFPPTYVRIIF